MNSIEMTNEMWFCLFLGFFLGFVVCDVLDKIVWDCRERRRKLSEFLERRGVNEHLQRLADLQKEHQECKR